MNILKTIAVSIFLSITSCIVDLILEVMFLNTIFNGFSYRWFIIYIIIIGIMSYFLLRQFIKADEFFNNVICIIVVPVFDYLLLVITGLIPSWIISNGIVKFLFGIYECHIKFAHILSAIIVVINIIWVKRKAIKERIFSFK